MKKVSLFVLLAILASTLLAAIPTTMVRLVIVNKSGYDVFMKLEGSPVTDGFYYLTVPSGTRDAPTVKVFTLMSDLYTRTTWQCGGLKSSGTLMVSGNLRLTFTPCGEKMDRCAYWQPWEKWQCSGDWVWSGGALRPVMELVPAAGWYRYKFHGTIGERRMEKVTYFKYLSKYANPWAVKMGGGYVANPSTLYLAIANLYAGYWNFGCFTWAYRLRTWKTPYGCFFAYQY